MFESIPLPELVPCGCGRSATGFCTGLHRLTDAEWDARVFDEAFVKEEVHGMEYQIKEIKDEQSPN